MPTASLSDLAAMGELIAGIASVGSLIAVAWQLRSLAAQTREATKQSRAAANATEANVYIAATQMTIDLDRFLVQNPDLRRILYGPPINGGEDDAHREEALAELVIDIFDAVLANNHHLAEDLSAGWVKYISHVLRHSEAVRRFWLAYYDWYGHETQRVIFSCMPPEYIPEHLAHLAAPAVPSPRPAAIART